MQAIRNNGVLIIGSLAQRPATAPKGTVYINRDTNDVYLFFDGAWAQLAITGTSDHLITDAVTAVATNVNITHNSSGAVAQGFGTGINLKSETYLTAENLATIQAVWASAVIPTSQLELYVANNGSLDRVGLIKGGATGSTAPNATTALNVVDVQTYRSAANQIVDADYGTIIGGSLNRVTGNSGSILGGRINFVDGFYAVIVGGDHNTAIGYYSGIVGGYTNEVTANGGYGAVVGGNLNTVNAEGAIVLGGQNVTANRRNEVLTGEQSYAKGTIQALQYRTATVHSSSAWFTLFGNATTARFTLPTNTLIQFEIMLVGATSGLTKSQVYKIEGAIKNDGGTTSLLTSTVTTVYEDDANFEAQVIADDTNDALLIQVRDATGAGDTLRWTATIKTVEVQYS